MAYVAAVIAAALGFAAGVAVTGRAHGAPASPGWAKRVGRTRPRRSDLPLGGTLALLVALILDVAGRPGIALVVAGLGIGAACGAVGTGLREPLPPVGD